MLQSGTNALEDEVRKYVALGYRVVTRTETSAQLVLPKTFSFGWAFVWFLCLGLGLIIYFAYYLAKTEPTVYLSLDSNGALQRQGLGAAAGAVCGHCGHPNSPSRQSCKKCRAPLSMQS